MDLREKIIQFVSVTDSSDDVARKYLEACAGDIDMAIGMHLENRAPENVATPQGPNGPPASSSSANDQLLSPETYEKIHGVRAPIPQTTGVLIGEEEVPRKILRSRKLPQTVFNPFQDYSALGSRVAHSSKRGSGKDRHNLAEMFRPPHNLLFNGTFHEAKLVGQQKMRWLLVNLQDSREFASQILNRDVWSDFHVKELIKTHFVFMQVYRINDEGAQFQNMYHIESYPSIVVIDPRTGEKMISWGALSANNFIREISEFLANNPYEEDGHEHKDGQHKRSIINLSEESQLKAAIEASLEESERNSHCLVFSDDSDSEHITLSPSPEPCSLKHSNSVGRTQNSGDSRTSSDIAVSGKKFRKRPSVSGAESSPRKRVCTRIEPMCTAIGNIEISHKDSSVPSVLNGKGKQKMKAKAARLQGVSKTVSKEENTVDELLATGDICREEVSQILFRLPDGSRLQKSFLCKHPVKKLFDFLESQGIEVKKHEVETHFPKRSLLSLDSNTSLKHNRLYPRETVFVSTA